MDPRVTSDGIYRNGKISDRSGNIVLRIGNVINCQVDSIIYVGDDERDIIAGRNAGMTTVAANFGFISDDTNINLWQADIIIDDPISLKKYLIN